MSIFLWQSKSIGKTMQEIEIKITATAPTILGNFDVIEAQLVEELKSYDLIVDESSVKTAKNMATKINKLSTKIDDLRKTKVKELSAPIKEFEENANKLKGICQISRQKLLSQIEKFEEITRQACLALLEKELLSQYSNFDVREEFQTISVGDLAIVSNKTKTGLAKKAVTEIGERVLSCKQHQDKIDRRLLALVGTCYENGLDAPLTRENINHFLMEVSDEVYDSKLKALIQNEITRLNAMLQRQQAQVKTTPVVENQTYPKPINQPIVEPIARQTVPSKYAHFRNSEFLPESSKKMYTVTATFEIEVEEKFESMLEAMLAKKLHSAGFKTTPKIKISKGVHHDRQAS